MTDDVPSEPLEGDFAGARLLIVDDDKPFLQRLARAMEKRGFETLTADSVEEAKTRIAAEPPAFAVVDMRLGDGNGLDVISSLHEHNPDARAIILTGYGNIATAVTAVKLGAIDYLSKPADADDIFAALTRKLDQMAPPPENLMSADRVRWEHIQSSAFMSFATAMSRKNRPSVEHASPHAAAYPGQARSALSRACPKVMR